MSINATNTLKRHRKKRAPISTRKHWEAVTSATRFEIFMFLSAAGPCSIAELARQMGTRADGLYHHVKKLVSAELVEEVGFRRVGKQTEAVFDVVADEFDFDTSVDSENFVKLLKSAHRRSERNFQLALENGLVNFDTRRRNTYVGADSSWLTRKEQLQVNSHLEAIFKIFAEGRVNREGELFSLTLNLSPIQRTRSPDDERQR